MRFWVFKDAEVPGTFEPSELVAMPDFGATTLVCPAEGEIQDKNWRAAGEFPILGALLAARPAPAREPDMLPEDVDKFLDTSNHKLFSKVTELMRELSAGRQEASLSKELQRQLAERERQLAKALALIGDLERRLAGFEVKSDAGGQQ